MASFAESLRPMLASIRAIPGQMGLRPHRVFYVTRTYANGLVGDGARTETATELLEGSGESPKTRWLKDDEIALGNLPTGSLTVGPITPTATIDALLDENLPNGASRHLRITGPQHPDGALYTVTSLGRDKALHYTIIASPADNDS